MEAVAMDKLIEKGGTSVQLAQAILEALDITLKAANFVTVPMLDARLAQLEAKMEARFSALERALETTKVWAALLYAGLVVFLFGALAVDHRWLLDRQDQFLAEENARIDRRIAEERALTDKQIAEERALTDKQIAEDRARTDKEIGEQQARDNQAQARMDAKLDQFRALLLNRLRKP